MKFEDLTPHPNVPSSLFVARRSERTEWHVV